MRSPRRNPHDLPSPVDFPNDLPLALLSTVTRRRGLLLCLDFDGTLSEIAPHPGDARLVAGAQEALNSAASNGKIEVAVVSGRDIGTLRRLLAGTRNLTLIGTHGLERETRGKVRLNLPRSKQLAPEIEHVRGWMSREVSRDAGLLVEDKRVAIALHYRLANPAVAQACRRKLRELIKRDCPHLAILEGKLVDEIVPAEVRGKGAALLRLSRARRNRIIAFFGDDRTDEDAFFALRNQGITVLVGPRRKSWACYRVDGPREVVAQLRGLTSHQNLASSD